MSFLGEIKRRKVFQVAAVYAVVAWLTIQIVDVVSEPLSLPAWLDTVVIVLLAVGFPIAIILAWAFDLTSEGVKAAAQRRSDSGAGPAPAVTFTYVIQGLVLLAVGFLVVDQYVLEPDQSINRNFEGDLAETRPVNRFAYQIPPEQQLRFVNRNAIAISPDGRRFLYNTTDGLYLREMGELDARRIPGTEENLSSLVFSPDSQSILFATESGTVRRMRIDGGESVALAEGIDRMLGTSWAADDTVLVANASSETASGIYRISTVGGSAELIADPAFGVFFSSPQLLPDGDTMVFAVWNTFSSLINDAQIVAQSIRTGERTVLVQGGTDPRYLPSGHLVYVFENSLRGVAFDPATLTISGGAVPLVTNVLHDPRSALSNYAISEDGTLAYLAGTAVSGLNTLAWIDREGNEEPINIQSRNYHYAQLSPDGTRVALDSRDDEALVWILDLERDTLQRLTVDQAASFSPVWLDDEALAYSWATLEGGGVRIQAADRSGDPIGVVEGTGGPLWPTGASPDGSTLFYRSDRPLFGIWSLPLTGDQSTGQLLLQSGDDVYESNPTLSPDGRWLAYESNESGETEIYVRPYPDVTSGLIQISTNGGTRPLWSRDGSELFYLIVAEDRRGSLMSVPINAEAGLVPGVPQELFAGNFIVPNRGRQTYDIAPDGQRFLMIKRDEPDEAEVGGREIVIVQNFIEEVERRIPTD